jgi:hypothetical protein
MTECYRRVADVDWVVAEDEAVLFDSRTGDLFELDRWATSIWSRLDGTGTLDQVAESVASAVGATRERIFEDVATFCCSLADLDLVEVVAPGVSG